MANSKFVCTISVDEDWLRLAAYRMALQTIAENGAKQPWERDEDEMEPHELAESALRAMGEWHTDTQPENK